MKVSLNYIIPVRARNVGFSGGLATLDSTNPEVLPFLPENRDNALQLIKQEQRELLGEFPYSVYGLAQPARTNMNGWKFIVPSTYYEKTRLPEELLTQLCEVEPDIRFSSNRVREISPFVSSLDLSAFRKVPPCDTFCITTPTRRATFLLSGIFKDVFGETLPLEKCLENFKSRMVKFRGKI